MCGKSCRSECCRCPGNGEAVGIEVMTNARQAEEDEDMGDDFEDEVLLGKAILSVELKAMEIVVVLSADLVVRV